MPKGKIQVTLIQIDNYGPWTLCLGPKREPDLQILQSELYADLQRLFSLRGGLVFYARFDNMLAVTNGIGIDEHKEIQESICRRYPITISMGVATGVTANEAQEKATKALQDYGSSQLAERRKILAVLNGPLKDNESLVQIAHIDVDDVTSALTDAVPAYDALLTMLKIHEALAEAFLKKEALVFFAGGDNFLALSNGLTSRDYNEILNDVGGRVGFRLKAGVGVAYNALGALELASKALDMMKRDEVKSPVYILYKNGGE
ncbi:MAG: GTP cyclohydrolase IIa [Candidatus Nezhaarchaeota archaeon]|nr:GTP cyclohydrolase IIa [Candidatus Nezhaarchaeota archaeon]